MQHAGLLLMIAVTGCATTKAIGVQAVAARHGSGSVEATVAGGVGLGTQDGAILVRGEGSLGAATGGGVQGRVQISDECVSFGRKMGWQLRVGGGGSFGAYQSPDLTVHVSGGPHWNLHRTDLPSLLRVTSIALDATVGYALHAERQATHADGPFVGIGLSLRRDQVTDLNLKYWPRSSSYALGKP